MWSFFLSEMHHTPSRHHTGGSTHKSRNFHLELKFPADCIGPWVSSSNCAFEIVTPQLFLPRISRSPKWGRGPEGLQPDHVLLTLDFLLSFAYATYTEGTQIEIESEPQLMWEPTGSNFISYISNTLQIVSQATIYLEL